MGKRSTSFPSWRNQREGRGSKPSRTALEPAVSFTDLPQRMDKGQGDCLSAAPRISLQRLLGVRRGQKGHMERGCSAGGWSLILCPASPRSHPCHPAWTRKSEWVGAEQTTSQVWNLTPTSSVTLMSFKFCVPQFPLCNMRVMTKCLKILKIIPFLFGS